MWNHKTNTFFINYHNEPIIKNPDKLMIKTIIWWPDSSAAIDEEGNIDDGEKNRENEKQHLEKKYQNIKYIFLRKTGKTRSNTWRKSIKI